VVSISADYDDMTKRLLTSFLKLNNLDAELAGLVRPRVPFRPKRRVDSELPASRVVRDIDEVDELVREIEAGERTVPVLFRQYLKLNARVLGFNMDPAFGNVLDSLMVVDLMAVNRAILDRFFGREAAQRFLNYHPCGVVAHATVKDPAMRPSNPRWDHGSGCGNAREPATAARETA
jgi:hypothetical protein